MRHEHDAQLLTRIAARLGRIGGWSIELPERTVRWSPELFAILEVEGSQPPDLAEGLSLYDDAQVLAEAVDRCATVGVPFDLEVGMHTRAGHRMWARVVGELVRDEAGRPARIVGALQDVTERHAAHERERALDRRVRATLESITDGCYALDGRWRFTFLNRTAERLVDRRRAELLGRRVWDEFPEAVGTAVEEAYRRARETGEVQRLDRYHFPPLQRWYEIAAHPWDDGLTVFFHDVTDQVLRERDLEAAVDDERATAERLRDLDRAKNAFLSAVSHELRTPLTVVRGMAHTLRDRGGELDDAVRERLTDALASNADRLDRLLADLLDVDRLTHGRDACRRERVDVVGLVHDVATAAVREGIVTQEPLVSAPATLVAEVDPVQLERMLHNLLENAGKYAPGATVEVRLLARGTGVRLEVVDDGPGIPDGELERIFEPFHRVASDAQRPGTGVGLALVATFAELHGGRAWAERRPGGGATLVVELPGPTPAATDPTAGVDADRELDVPASSGVAPGTGHARG